MRLLGMDMKMRQYELGKAFCDAVAAEGGIDLLNRVWDVARGAADAAELEPARRAGPACASRPERARL